MPEGHVGNFFVRAFITNNLLSWYGSAECDTVTDVSEQMKISPSELPMDFGKYLYKF